MRFALIILVSCAAGPSAKTVQDNVNYTRDLDACYQRAKLSDTPNETYHLCEAEVDKRYGVKP